MRRSKFTTGIIAGSIVGASAGMYAITKMSPRQRRKMMKQGRKILFRIADNVDLF